MTPRWHFGLLGEKIQYSKSPAIFSAIGSYLDLSISFEVYDVAASQVTAVLAMMREGKIGGLSVTIPYKELVISHLDSLSSDAEKTGAVNCVAIERGRLVGYNTDGFGFLKPLLSAEIAMAGATALIFGSGGAARAVAHALGTSGGIGELVIVSRKPESIRAITQAAGTVPVKWLSWQSPSDWRTTLDRSALIVNATPLGGGNYPDGGGLRTIFDSPCQGIYYDLNYNDDNQLIQRATGLGLRVIDGKQMLVAQALESMRVWSGQSVPFGETFEKAFSGDRTA